MGEHWTDSVDGTDLWRLLKNMKHMVNPFYRNGELWAAVAWAFGVGMDTSERICRRAGFDPETKVKDIG